MNYTTHYGLQKDLTIEKYDVNVVNMNSDIIDSALHRLDLKNQSQDNLLASKEELNDEISRAIRIETELSKKLDNEIERSEYFDQEFADRIDDLLLTISDNKYKLFQIVDNLPTTDISPSKIYLLLNSDETENNKYSEYIYVNGEYVDDQLTNGSWERIGIAEINLDGYVTSEYLNSILQNYIRDNEYETEAINFSQIFT